MTNPVWSSHISESASFTWWIPETFYFFSVSRVVQFSKIISCSPNFQETCCEVRMPVFLFTIRNVYEAMDHNTGVSWAVPFPLCRKRLWEDTLYWVGLLVRWPWGGVCGEGALLILFWPLQVGSHTAGQDRILHNADDRLTLSVFVGAPVKSLLSILFLLLHSSQVGHSLPGKDNAVDLRMELWSPGNLSDPRD